MPLWDHILFRTSPSFQFCHSFTKPLKNVSVFMSLPRTFCALQNLKKSEILENHIEVLKAKIHVLFWDFKKVTWPIYEAIVGPLKFLYIFWNFRAQWYDIESNRRGCNILLVFATNTTNYSTRKWRRGNQFRLIHHNAIFLLKWAFLALYNAI